jgi:acyl carrier protein
MSTSKLEEEYGFEIWDEEVALESALTNIITV